MIMKTAWYRDTASAMVRDSVSLNKTIALRQIRYNYHLLRLSIKQKLNLKGCNIKR